jgi:1-Cys peroxiredoxin 6
LESLTPTTAQAVGGYESLPYPIIADDKRELAVQLGMLDADEKDKAGVPLTARAVFIIGPDKKVKLSLLYPATTGRNFDEVGHGAACCCQTAAR